MRHCKLLLQKLLAKWIKDYRTSHHLTQECMAEKMRISPRSYSDLERGIYCLSAMALMYFMVLLSDSEVLRLIREFRRLIEGAERNVVA